MNTATSRRQTVKNALRAHPELFAVVRSSVYAVRGLYGTTFGRLLTARSRDYLTNSEDPSCTWDAAT